MRVLEQTRKIQVLVADLQVIMFRNVAYIGELERIQDFDHTKFVTRKCLLRNDVIAKSRKFLRASHICI